jgi:hypothetical protein
MAQRGGARPGAGRKAGGQNKEKIEVAAKLAEATELLAAEMSPDRIAAMSPLDVMLHAMKIAARASQWPQAASLAEKAAPYLHPKLSSETLSVRSDDSQRSEDDIRREILELERAAASRTAAQSPPRTPSPRLPEQPSGVVH